MTRCNSRLTRTSARLQSASSVLIAGITMIPVCNAQNSFNVGVPARGTGSVGISLQRVDASIRVSVPASQGGGFRETGEVSLRSATVEFDYGLTDRLALSASLPFRSNRYTGSTPHNPALLDFDHGERLQDDGRYHSNFADWGVGLRYLWRTGPVAITPFVAAHWPSSDYPIFTLAAAGTQQWSVDTGINLGGAVPGPWRNLYWQLGYAYTYVEKTRPIDLPSHRVNRSVVNVELGYLIDPQWSVRATWRYRRTHDGLTPPTDFNFNFRNDLWYYHDQLFPLEQSVLQIGLGYRVNDHYAVSASVGRTAHVSFGSDISRAVTVGVSRNF